MEKDMASSIKGLAPKNSSLLLKALRTWGAFIFLIASSLSAQVAVTANIPAYHFQVLAGSTRQINVQITSGGVQCTQPAHMCTINWTIVSSTGGGSATFTDPKNNQVSSINGALPT